MKQNIIFHDDKNSIIQARLTLNSPDDKYEQEADAMANKVMRMPSNETVKPDTGLIDK